MNYPDYKCLVDTAHSSLYLQLGGPGQGPAAASTLPSGFPTSPKLMLLTTQLPYGIFFVAPTHIFSLNILPFCSGVSGNFSYSFCISSFLLLKLYTETLNHV